MTKQLPENWDKLSVDEKLEKWLNLHPELDENAKTMLENFVASCPRVTEKDYMNFLLIDTRDFPGDVQVKLLEGFIVIYHKKDNYIDPEMN